METMQKRLLTVETSDSIRKRLLYMLNLIENHNYNIPCGFISSETRTDKCRRYELVSTSVIFNGGSEVVVLSASNNYSVTPPADIHSHKLCAAY